MTPSRTPPPSLLAQQAVFELTSLLNAVPASRQVLKHLAALEKALARAGLAAIEKLPQDSLQRACLQLSRLPLPPEARALRQLQTMMQLALQDRRARELEARAGADALDDAAADAGHRSSFFNEGAVEVRTATDSDFRRAMDEMARQPQPGRATPPLKE